MNTDLQMDYAQNGLQGDVFISRQTPNGEFFIYDKLFCANHSEVYIMYSKKIEDFGNHLLLNKGLGEVTREGYKRFISIVLNRLNNTIPEHKEFQEHIIWMHSKKYSHSHILNTSIAIEHFTEFNGDKLIIAKTRRPKTLIKYVLTEAEIALMIRFTNNLREKAIISLLAYTGIRTREFCNLKVEDLDIGNNKVIIRNGKYSKDRRINMGALCSNVLMEYLIEYKKDREDFLFTTIVNNNQYDPSDLRKFVKIIAKRAKITKRVFPNLLRHSLATNLLTRGANIFLIKDQLGHQNIETTVVYILRLPYQIKKEYEKFIPSYL